MTASRLPIRIGVYWHGVAQPVEGGIVMRSAFGPYVEQIADAVEHVTLVAHDPPAEAERGEYLADYVAIGDNMEMLSLGDVGGRGDYLARMRRVARRVGPASESWDVLVLRFGRRSNLVFRANRCPRLASIVWGTAMADGLAPLLATWSPTRIAFGLRQEWHLRRELRGSGLALTDGEACLERYRHLVPGENMSLLRSSSRRARFTHRVEDRLRRPDPRFLVVGHVTADKGVFDAIDAFVTIRRELYPRATLSIVGIGSALAEARRRARASGHGEAITFHGWVPAGEDLFSLYRDSDVLLFLSRSSAESLPRVVSEAWAHSVLVVATPVGSLPIAYQHRRELLFVPVGAPRAASDAVRELVEHPDLRRTLLRESFERAEEVTLEHVTGALIDAIARTWPTLTRARGA